MDEIAESNSEVKTERKPRTETLFLGDLEIKKRLNEYPDNPLMEKLELIYRTPDGNEIRINDFLPPSWKLVEKDRAGAYADHGSKIVVVPYHTLSIIDETPQEHEKRLRIEKEEENQSLLIRDAKRYPDKNLVVSVESRHFLLVRGSFLTLLHEIGHAWEKSERDPEDIVRETELRNETRGDNQIVRLTEKELEDYKKLVIPSEEKSWDWALKTLYELRSKGINFEPLMSDDEIDDYIKISLDSYYRIERIWRKAR